MVHRFMLFGVTLVNTATQSERLQAAAHIRNVWFPGARGIRTRREFEGPRNSVIRGQQLDALLETHAQGLRRSQVTVLPRPHHIPDVNSTQYRGWLMTRAQGVDM